MTIQETRVNIATRPVEMADPEDTETITNYESISSLPTSWMSTDFADRLYRYQSDLEVVTRYLVPRGAALIDLFDDDATPAEADPAQSPLDVGDRRLLEGLSKPDVLLLEDLMRRADVAATMVRFGLRDKEEFDAVARRIITVIEINARKLADQLVP